MCAREELLRGNEQDPDLIKSVQLCFLGQVGIGQNVFIAFISQNHS